MIDEVAAEPRWQLPRPSSNRVIGGVAAGLADEIGTDPFVIRVAFVVLATAGGWGAVLYVLLWVLMQVAGVEPDEKRREPKAASETTRLVGLGLVVLGLILFFRELGGPFVESLVWPVALFGAGAVVAHEQGVDLARSADRLAGGDRDRSAFLVRAAGGALLVLSGIVLALSLNFDLSTAWNTLLVAGVLTAGLALVVGPWVIGLVNDLTAERRARIRADERAQVAAHLHDSVLQTLSLIQRRADDPSVVTLARQQERELRSWLYGREPQAGRTSFRSALQGAMAEVEDRHQVPVELVVVGDAELDARLESMLSATREATTNAVVHSGATVVDVFAEITPEAVDVFVRDTGAGFDRSAVPADRRGLADSIVGRIERIGGRAAIHTAQGEGTEVELHVARSGS